MTSSETSATPYHAEEWQHTLLTWFAENKRALPWRETSDPYRIWVSEVILQQTRVAQGWAYYERFIAAFPTAEALAKAEEEDVLRLWQGLGYYSRARNMHRAAKQICELGAFPTTYAEIRALSGIGDYTAAAISSIAYGLPTAVVDGNVYRVLSRFFADNTPIDSTQGKKHFAELAQALLPEKSPGVYNQAIMDFGAMQCTPKSPKCDTCPLQQGCLASARENVQTFPVKSKKTKVETRHMVYLIVHDTLGKTWLHQRQAGDIWQGLYEFPLLEFNAPPTLKDIKGHPFYQRCIPHEASFRNVTSSLTHQLTHRLLKVDCYEIYVSEDTPVPEGFTAVLWENLTDYPLPQLIVRLTKLVKKAGSQQQ